LRLNFINTFCQRVLTGWILISIFSLSVVARNSDKLIFSHENFLIQYSPRSEKTARSVAELINFHKTRFEKFYEIQIEQPVNIIISDSQEEFRVFGQNGLPVWAAAAYIAHHDLIIVKNPAWAGSLPGLEHDFVHELSHLYFFRKFKENKLPLWYNEGLAEFLSGSQIEMTQAFKISNALFTGNIIALEDIDSLLYFRQPRAELAYLESLSAVLYLSELLLKGGDSFQAFHDKICLAGWEKALQESIGTDELGFELDWLNVLEKKYRWTMLINFDNILWVILVIILFLAMYVIRLRNKKRLRRWEEESDQTSFDAF
jgi:cbb3-type cytochrome oxidase subunit 3